MTKDEALKLALEALDVCQQSNYGRDWVWPDTAHPTAMANVKEAIAAIREALALSESSTKCEETSHAQPEQEPVATVAEVHMSRYTIEWTNGPLSEGTPLYTAPPSNSMNSIKSSNTLDAQRKPLTDEMKSQCPYGSILQGAFYDGWLKAEAAHGIKE